MNKVKKLSASKQVLFTFVTLCALLLIIGGLFFFSLLSIERNNQGQFRAMNKLAEIDDASQDVERMQAAVLRQLLASDIGETNRLDQTVRDIWNTNVNDLDDYHKFVDTEKEKQLYARVIQMRKVYWEQIQPVLTLGLSNQDVKAAELIISKQTPAYDEYLKAINELTDYVETDADKTAHATTRFISTIKIISNVLIGMAMLIAIGTGFAVVKVTRRLKEDNKVLQTEIKERKQTEEELSWKTAFLEAQVNSSIDGILVVDAQGKQILQSQRFTDLLKIPKHIADDKDDRQQVRWVTDTTKNPEQFVEKVTYLYSHPNETSRDEVEFKDGTTLDRYSSPVVGKDGKYYGRIWTFRDITERKRIEDLLRESEERFSGAFQYAPIGVALVSPAGRWIKVNRALCDLVGYSEAELLVRSFQGVTHPENLEVSKENVRQLNAGEIHSFQTEKRYVHKLGHFVTVLLNVSLVRDGQGRPLYMIAQIQDITARKRTEEALNEAQALYHSLVDQMPAGVFRKDAEGRFVFVNSWYCQIKGMTPEQILGKTPQELATGEFVNHPEAAKEIQLAVQGADNHKWIMETSKRIDVEEQYPGADGKIQFWQVVKSPVFGSDGKIIGTQGIFFDITERKQADAALAQERNLLRTMIDNSPDTIYIKDLAGRKTLANPAELKNMGCQTEAEAIGKSDFDVYPQEMAAGYFADDQAVIQTGQPLINREEKTVTGSGETRWHLSSKIPLRNAAGNIIGLIGMNRDITLIKEAETKLRQVHKQLLETSRQAGMAEVASNVLHNVGNVLNSVNISAGLVVDSVKKSKTASLAKVAAMLREHEHDLGTFITTDAKGKQLPAYLAQLSEHLLADQKITIEELDLLLKNIGHIKEIVTMQQSYARVSGVKEIINLRELVEDSLRMNVGALGRHGVEVIREFEDMPLINIDKHKVLQVLVNLIRNAKHACQDSERTDKQLTVRMVNGDGRIKISVLDNGVGIPPGNLIRIFNHGFTTRKDGHGFGLHSGALAAKEMGGSLNAYSSGSGQGATFTLELPCITNEDANG